MNERARRLLLPGLIGSPHACVAAVCSRDAAKAVATARALGPDVRAFAGVEAMVQSGDVHAVYVNTPAQTHHAVCMAAIRAGCAVICEKPLAADTGQAVELLKAAATAGVRTVVNFTYRSMPGYRLTERLLATYDLGRPLHAEFALLQGHNFLPGFPQVSALLDSGVHLFDTLGGLSEAAHLGKLTQVCAAPMLREEGPDYGWGFTGRTELGVVVSALFTRSALGWRNGLRWALYGTETAILVELDADRTDARLARPGHQAHFGSWQPVALPPDLRADDERFPAYHMDRLVRAVRGAERFPGFAEAVATHRLADALAASRASGRWTAVAPGGR